MIQVTETCPGKEGKCKMNISLFQFYFLLFIFDAFYATANGGSHLVARHLLKEAQPYIMVALFGGFPVNATSLS
jgi:hypothetical protein